MMTEWLKTDLTALTGIAGGALLGGLATVALLSAAEPHPAPEAPVDAACAAEGMAPRVLVQDAGARIVVAPGVRIGVGSTCLEGSVHTLEIRAGEVDMHEVRVRIQEARDRVDEARVRAEEARARAEEARRRAAEVRVRMERLRPDAPPVSH